jgi:hypothetical protein
VAALVLPEDELHGQVKAMPPDDMSKWGPAQTALSHGGRFVDDGTGERIFCTPWAFPLVWDFVDTPDGFIGREGQQPAVAMAPAHVFRERSLGGVPIARVPIGYLKVISEMPSDRVLGIELPDGSEGWVSRAHVWTIWDRPVCFGWRAGEWRIVKMGTLSY